MAQDSLDSDDYQRANAHPEESMNTREQTRRLLLKSAAGVVAAQCLPHDARASATGLRQEWQQFKATSQYASFRSAIALMRANTDPLNPSSLAFWANVHVNHCPHGQPYFIAWHRGYLYHFERQLRIVSGNPDLMLPYWDYYANATLPIEFTDPAPDNPLYLQRMGANVHAALNLAPFAPAVFNFQRGTTNAFEPKIEDVHNPVHDLIGGIMSTMQSPLDPIFYLHHASIDRLTHAWALPDGKGIPYSSYPFSSHDSNPYWAGSHVYATGLSMARYLTLDPAWLGIDYVDTAMPAALPAARAAGQPAPAAAPLRRPPFVAFTPTPPGQRSATRRSLGGIAQPVFDRRSVSARIRLAPGDAADVARIVGVLRQKGEAGGEADGQTDRGIAVSAAPGAVKVVIDNALIGELARRGGFFYALYLNLPAQVDAPSARAQSWIGTLGAFQIAAASHHGPARLEFDVTELLAQQEQPDFSTFSLSWVRVDGESPPAGVAIRVDEIRLELAFEAQPAPAPRKPALQGWYGR